MAHAYPYHALAYPLSYLASGKERTEAEYAELLAGAGWRPTRTVLTKSPASVIEGAAA